MELKNVYSYPKFKKINEAIDISNDAGWSETLIGSGINRLFSLFRRGIGMGIAAKTIQDMTTVLNGVVAETVGQANVNDADTYEKAKAGLETMEMVKEYIKNHNPNEIEIYLNSVYTKYLTLQSRLDELKATDDQKGEINNIVNELDKLAEENNIKLDDGGKKDFEQFESTFGDIFNNDEITSTIEQLKSENSDVFKKKSLRNDIFQLIYLYKFGRLISNFYGAYGEKFNKMKVKSDDNKKEIDDGLTKLDNLFINFSLEIKKTSTKYIMKDTKEKQNSKIYKFVGSKDENINTEYKDIGSAYNKRLQDMHQMAINSLNESEIYDIDDYKINEGVFSKAKKKKAESKGEDILNDYKSMFENNSTLRKIAQEKLVRRKHKFTSLYLRFLRVAGLDVPEIVRSKMTPNFNINEADAQKANSFFETKLFDLFDEYGDFFTNIEEINPKKLIKDNSLLSGIIAGEKGDPGSDDNRFASAAKAKGDVDAMVDNGTLKKTENGLAQGSFGIFMGAAKWYLVVCKTDEKKIEKEILHIYKIIDVISQEHLDMSKIEKGGDINDSVKAYKNASYKYALDKKIFEELDKTVLADGENLKKELEKNQSSYFISIKKNIIGGNKDKGDSGKLGSDYYFNFTHNDDIISCKGNKQQRKILSKNEISHTPFEKFFNTKYTKNDKQLRVSYPTITEGVYIFDDEFWNHIDKDYTNIKKTGKFSQLLNDPEKMKEFIQKGFD
jgi:hypothetical protein